MHSSKSDAVFKSLEFHLSTFWILCFVFRKFVQCLCFIQCEIVFSLEHLFIVYFSLSTSLSLPLSRSLHHDATFKLSKFNSNMQHSFQFFYPSLDWLSPIQKSYFRGKQLVCIPFVIYYKCFLLFVDFQHLVKWATAVGYISVLFDNI